MTETPLLLLLFNRPDLTRELISILRPLRPSNIYIAVDGPRLNNRTDVQKVAEVLDIARSIDWTPHVQFLIREQNLGCGKAVSSAISWLFDYEDRGIILEDDCHPAPDFFPFCDNMLARYAEDERIATIAGHSFVPDDLCHPAKYFFSKYSQIWGWATWRRFWSTYDFKLASCTYDEWKALVSEYTFEGLERNYWFHVLDAVWKGDIDTWDYQLQFCAWRNHQLHVNPGVNLICNAGYREDATHTKIPSRLACRPTSALSGPFLQQPVEWNLKRDGEYFLVQLMAAESMLIHIVQAYDDTYTHLRSWNQALGRQNQELIDLNKRLTQTAEEQYEYLQVLNSALQASSRAFQARIDDLERLVADKQTILGFLSDKIVRTLRARFFNRRPEE